MDILADGLGWTWYGVSWVVLGAAGVALMLSAIRLDIGWLMPLAIAAGVLAFAALLLMLL